MLCDARSARLLGYKLVREGTPFGTRLKMKQHFLPILTAILPLIAAAPPLTPPAPIKPSADPPARVVDVVPPAPVVDTLSRKIAPAAPIRGDGVNFTNHADLDAVIRDTHFEGWSQNII